LRFGEVREGRVGGQPVLRGTVATVSLEKVPPRIERDLAEDQMAGNNEAETGQKAKALDEEQVVKKFWEKLEVPNARPFVVKYEKRGAEVEVVKLWLEALRPKN
jgi:hypothetical protein